MRVWVAVVVVLALAAFVAVVVAAQTQTSQQGDKNGQAVVVSKFKAWLKRFKHAAKPKREIAKMWIAFKRNVKAIIKYNKANADNLEPHAILSFNGPNVGLSDDQRKNLFGYVRESKGPKRALEEVAEVAEQSAMLGSDETVDWCVSPDLAGMLS